jgi:hypothetical protein
MLSASLGLVPQVLRAFPARARADHPTPRPGITGGKVATPAMLDGDTVLIELFDAVRAIPHVVDGIRCHCGCAELNGHYSLLTCYEGANAMARICPICQGEGRVAVRMAKAGRSLADIRVAIDAQYG